MRWNQIISEQPSQMTPSQMEDYISHHHGEKLHSDYVEFLNTFTSFRLTSIPISKIHSDLPNLDASKVAEYTKLDFSTAPPIVVYEDGKGGYLILDGYHRASTAKELKITEMSAYLGRR